MPDTSSSSIPKPDLHKGDEIAGWKVLRELGCGGFGSVFEVEKNGIRAALKAEFVSTEYTQALKREVPVLRVMQWSNHFCRLYVAGVVPYSDRQVNIMVMTLVGKPLSKMRRQCPEQRFTRSTAIRLTKQCLTAVRHMHETGYIHRDVKGGNFAWSEGRTVYLLDMGFARRYMQWTSSAQTAVTFRRIRKKAGFLGTSRYCSPYVHEKLEQGRRDDLWGLFYMMVEFITGSLPWRNDSDRVTAIKKKKVGSSILNGCPVELYNFYDHLRALEVRHKPNYDLLMRSLESICTRCGFKDEDPMDFEMGGRHYEHFVAEGEHCEDPSTREILTEEMSTAQGEIISHRGLIISDRPDISSDSGEHDDMCLCKECHILVEDDMEVEIAPVIVPTNSEK